MQEFYSNGKLLLSGEYVILDGAIGLAIPTAYGQSLQIKNNDRPNIKWKSIAVDTSIWFEVLFDTDNLEIIESSDLATAVILQKILRQAKVLNSEFLSGSQGYSIASFLGFDRSWGLGSSSTLINNIAQWAQIDSFDLQRNSLSGSGYDIASAQNNSPILYHLYDGRPVVENVHFNPAFRDQLFFIHLNQKQNSREGIARYRNQMFDKPELIKLISGITQQMLTCTSLSEFEKLLKAHENLIATHLNLTTVQSNKFPDYSGSIKSLGAWGGDFILATGTTDAPNYFKEKGYNTIVPFSEMIL